MKRLLPTALRTGAFLVITGLLCYDIYQDNQAEANISEWQLATNANLATLSQLQVARYTDMDQRLQNTDENLGKVYEATQQAFQEVNAKIENNARQSQALAQQAANTAQTQEQIVAQLQGYGQSLQALSSRYQQVLAEQAEQINALGGNQQALNQNSAALYSELSGLQDHIGLLQSQITATMQYARQNELRTRQVQQVQEEAIIPALNQSQNPPQYPVQIIQSTPPGTSVKRQYK